MRAVVGFFLCICLGANAPASTTTVEGQRVFVNELLVATFASTKEASRFASVVRRVPNGSAVKVVPKRRSARVFAGGTEVLFLSKATASAYSSSPAGLANEWGGRLRRALALPSLKIGSTSLTLGGSGVSSVSLIGTGAKTASIESSDDSVATAARSTGTLTIRAKGFGETSIVVSSGASVQTISVRVWPSAAHFPQTLSATVTGIPATTNIVQGAVIGAIRNQLKTVREADIKFDIPTGSSLAPEGSTTIPVRVRATGSSCLPAEGLVYVTVRNAGLGRLKEGELWYCNDPETIKAPGLLFSAQLQQASSARLLYHHLNASPGGIFIEILVINDSDQPARLILTPGEGKPDPNPVLAGAEAAESFYRNYVWSAGEVVTVPARSTFPLVLRRLAPRQTLSGLCYLRLLEGGPSQLSVVAAAKGTFGLDSRWTAAMASSTPWRYIGSQRITGLTPKIAIYSDHIYPNPFKTEEVSYLIGGRHPFIRIGENAIPRLDKQSALSGNFGVTYTIKAAIQNPFDQAVDLEMVFEASAGYSGALFIFNGEIRRTPLIQPKREVVFGRLRIEGLASRNLTIQTIPLSGSSYPATITVRPAESSMRLVSGLHREGR